MTDMRATERLLEVIDEVLNEIEAHFGSDAVIITNRADEAIAELRKRGDTLVRADDLRRVLPTAEAGVAGYASGDWSDAEEGRWSEAIRRLENAIGGKLR